jgi:hypothetical protein
MNEAKQYLKNPERIKAIQWTGENFEKIKEFLNNEVFLKDNKLFIKQTEESSYEIDLTDFISEENGQVVVMSEENFNDQYQLFEDHFVLVGAIPGSFIITPTEIQGFKKRGIDLGKILEEIQKEN